MATSSTPLTNIGGMASGLDTNSIVTQLVALRKQPAVLLDSQISKIDARKNGLQGISNMLTSLKAAATALSATTLWDSSQTVAVSDSNILSATRSALTAPGGYSINVASLARAEQKRTASSFTAAGSDDVLHIAVGSGDTKDVAITSGDSLDSIAGKINAVAGIGAYASVVNNRLYLSGKSTGASNTISLTSDAALASDMGMTISSSAASASYTVNGGAVQASDSNTVKDAVAGLAITLKQTGTSTLSIGDAQASADGVADKLQAFVDAYNAATKPIKNIVSQQPVAKPTTQSEINAGALFNNSTLQGSLNNLRGWSSHSVGSSSMLSSLGIAPPAAGSTIATGPPQLAFDRQKFLDAYAADPSKIKDMVSKYTNDASTEGLSQWAGRQVDALNGTSGSIALEITGQGSQKKLLQDRQTRINDRAAIYETNLRRQYTHLETALSALNSQTGQLTGQINAMNKSG